MKTIIPILTVSFLATMALAQEESASPAESAAPATTEEKASATVEETPAAKAEESAAPATEKKAEAAAGAKPAASAGAKTQTTTAATATGKVAPAGAAMNTKNMGVKEMENAWEAAVGKHDIASIDPMVAADFVGISSKGKFVNRSQILAEFKTDKDTYKTAKNEKLNVKMFGPNVAVVTGRAREIGTGKDGKPFDRAFLFTDTWMMRGGKWQCIASQVNKIKG